MAPIEVGKHFKKTLQLGGGQLHPNEFEFQATRTNYQISNKRQGPSQGRAGERAGGPSGRDGRASGQRAIGGQDTGAAKDQWAGARQRTSGHRRLVYPRFVLCSKMVGRFFVFNLCLIRLLDFPNTDCCSGCWTHTLENTTIGNT